MNTRKNKIVITMEDMLKSEDDVSANDYNAAGKKMKRIKKRYLLVKEKWLKILKMK